MDYDQLQEENSLLGFHMYAQFNATRVIELGDEICEILDASIGGDRRVEASLFMSAYDKYWFWVLGAYEVLRTLVDKDCKGAFSEEVEEKMVDEKRKIAKLRMPFAKLQPKNVSKAIHGDNSITNVDIEKKDFGFTIKSEVIWVRTTIYEFKGLIESLTSQDVRRSMKSIIG